MPEETVDPSGAPMSPERWQKVYALFHEALDHPPGDRAAFLEEACPDAEIRRDVERLLEADAADALLDTGREGLRLSVEAPSMKGRTIGPYRLEEEIGRGGMGVVYRATRTDVGRTVALKMLRERFPSTERVQRFLREQQLLGRLQHPAIAQFMDAGLTGDGTPYFVLEFVDGRPVTEVAAGLSLPERLRLFADVCAAVQFAHRRLIVHRDLKPSNVLVTGDGTVKLLDFGIAKLLEDDAGLTRSGEHLLTPAYAAPEQATGDALSTATDVYALGVLLYEMLTGTRPIEVGDAPLPVAVQRILEETPAAPSDRVHATGSLSPAALRGDLDTICLTALRKEPERRYESVTALREDVERFLADRPITARPDTLTYRAGKFVRRNRTATFSSVGVLVMLAAILSFYTSRLADERDRAVANAERAKSVTEFLIHTLDEASPNAAGGDTLTVFDVLDRAESRAGVLSDDPVLHANILDAIGRVRLAHRQVMTADTLFRTAREQRRRMTAERDPLLAISNTRIAAVRLIQGRYEDVDSLMNWNLSVYQKDRPHDVQLGSTLGILAKSKIQQREFGAADSLLQRAISLKAPHLPPHHPDLIDLYTLHAEILMQDERYEQARAVYQKSYNGMKRRYPGGHVSLSATLGNMARVEQAMGNYPDADSLFTLSLNMMRRLVGSRHADTATILTNMGTNAYEAGDFAGAERYFEEALRIRKGIGSDASLSVASIHNNLGAVYMNTDRFADAASHFQSARDVMVTRLGPRHPHAITTLNNLAGVAEEAGDLERAEVLRRDVLAQLAGVVPEWSVHRRMALKNLGTLLVKTGDYEEAETHLNESLNLRRMFLPAPHPKIASTLSGLGELYRARQRWDEAVAVYREALEMRKATTPDHVQTVMMQLYLGDALRGAGAYEEAEPLVVEGYEKIQTRPNVKQLWQQEAADVLSRFYTSRDERRRTGSLRDSRAEIGSEIDAAAPTATTAAN